MNRRRFTLPDMIFMFVFGNAAGVEAGLRSPEWVVITTGVIIAAAWALTARITRTRTPL